ncbi:hypothetical protein ACFQFQ_03940 [Sulfitobacter porphyrae]|uniref:Uncharacterized protein n=1 Tax=Sulfitobacter porphyrae TaxID=1246864 RepID=A0ABW2B0T8_9RHOB
MARNKVGPGGLNKDRLHPLRQVGRAGGGGPGQFMAEGAAMIRGLCIQTAQVSGEVAHGDEGFHAQGIVAIGGHVMGRHGTEYREHQRGAVCQYGFAQALCHAGLTAANRGEGEVGKSAT